MSSGRNSGIISELCSPGKKKAKSYARGRKGKVSFLLRLIPSRAPRQRKHEPKDGGGGLLQLRLPELLPPPPPPPFVHHLVMMPETRNAPLAPHTWLTFLNLGFPKEKWRYSAALLIMNDPSVAGPSFLGSILMTHGCSRKMFLHESSALIVHLVL